MLNFTALLQYQPSTNVLLAIALVREDSDSEVKKKKKSSALMHKCCRPLLKCHSLCNWMDMYLFTPSVSILTVHKCSTSTWHVTLCADTWAVFRLECLLVLLLFSCIRKDPYHCSPLLSLRHQDTHKHRIKIVFRHQMELIHKSDAELVY